jgi:hypothetical protein
MEEGAPTRDTLEPVEGLKSSVRELDNAGRSGAIVS